MNYFLWILSFSEENKKLKDLKPALSLKSTIISLQEVKEHEGVSYNHKRIAEKNSIAATIPFWYYEGWMRTLSGKLTYYYNSKPAQQLGTICMNISSVLATPEMKIWDKIELIGIDNKKEDSIIALAKKANTIPYEILIRLDRGIRRIVK